MVFITEPEIMEMTIGLFKITKKIVNVVCGYVRDVLLLGDPEELKLQDIKKSE
jgi:hypothetical protein